MWLTKKGGEKVVEFQFPLEASPFRNQNNPHKLDIGEGIDTFCRNGQSMVGGFLLLCRLTQFARALGGDLDAPCNGRSNFSVF
jgi:hypothetical protein